MAGVKTVAFPEQFARPLAKSVENAIGDIEQPGAEGEKQRRDKRQVEVHGASEEPRPKSGNGWRIQAEQMPPFRKIVAATGQDSVYFARHRTYSMSLGQKQWWGLPPDFLWGLVEPRNFMRLSLQKALHAVLCGAAYRKSGSPRLFRPTYPDFLSRLVALSHSMRLSLKKAAHAILSDAA